MSIVNGVVIAQVTDVQADTASVKLNYPWLDPKHETDWARIATTMAGGGRGRRGGGGRFGGGAGGAGGGRGFGGAGRRAGFIWFRGLRRSS